jgi:hypothetical protein
VVADRPGDEGRRVGERRPRARCHGPPTGQGVRPAVSHTSPSWSTWASSPSRPRARRSPPAENAQQVLAALSGVGASLDSHRETHARGDMDDQER